MRYIVLAALAAALAGCGDTETPPQPQVQALPPSPAVTAVDYAATRDGRWISKDGLIELTLSDEWRANNAPTTVTNLQLQAINSQGTGLSLADRDGRDIADLRAFSGAAETRMIAALTNSQTWPAQDTTINGHPAVQFEYAGVFRGERAHCLATVIQTETMVSLLVGCTVESKFVFEREKIMVAATGLRERTMAATNPPPGTPALPPDPPPPTETSTCQMDGEHIGCR